MRRTKAKTLLICLAMAGIPLITIGTCDPRTGILDIYRDDDRGRGIFDVFIDGWYYYDDYYYDYDDDYYYDHCFLCF